VPIQQQPPEFAYSPLKVSDIWGVPVEESDLRMKRSIVLTDWGRHNEPTVESRDSFLYELILLSMLYDEVLIQDEVFVCSKKLARWFYAKDQFDLFTEVINACGVIILKRPVARYPSELQEQAQKHPITARVRHLQRYSVADDGGPISFGVKQDVFQSALNTLLLRQPTLHRDAGGRSKQGGGLMQRFGSDLIGVWGSTEQRTELRILLPRIT
jgi:hypothetical protein